MKFKLTLSLLAVPILGLMVAAAVAQTFRPARLAGGQIPTATAAAPADATRPAARSADVTADPNFRNGQQAGTRTLYVNDFSTTAYAPYDRSLDPLVEQLKEATTDDGRDKIKDQLREILVKQFTARQEKHEKEIADLEAKIKNLRNLVAKRQENRREIVENRLAQIVRDAQGLGW
jgi:flagellar motility protein MotE (MotC chaperone)